MRSTLKTLTGIAVLCGLTGPAIAETSYVDADASPGGDGTSWPSAFVDLQDALAAARVPGATIDAIWIAQGTYIPHPSDAAVSFELVDGVSLYGGFAGGETSLEQRDLIRNETTLSGDIGGDDIVGSGSGWYLNWNITTSNSGHVIDGSGVGPDTVIDGLIIAAGSTGPSGTPAGHPLMFGGGLFLVGGSPTVRDCTFTHCLAAFASGGAIYCLDGNPTIERCHFPENYVHLGNGGGLFFYGTSTPIVRDCTFTYNIGVAASGETSGAGMAHRASTDITVERCTFHGNLNRPFYSIGSDLAWGGGLWNFNGHMTVRDCVFTDNRSNVGGGFMTWGPATLLNCLFTGNTAVSQPNDPYPEAGGIGAAIYAFESAGEQLTVVNCTITRNHGKKNAVACAGNGEMLLRNTIVWGNTATHPDVQGTWRVQIAGNFDLAFCDVEHIFDPPEPGEDPIDPENLPGCLDADPLFVALGDERLATGSPCIDRGQSSAVPANVQTDLDGADRFVDDPDAPDLGEGNPVVDLGAYERQIAPPPCPADIDQNGDVGFSDLVTLLASWGSCGGCAADIDQNGEVGFSDLIALLAAWGPC